MINKCPNCGAGLEFDHNNHQAKCPYCNSYFCNDNTETNKNSSSKDIRINNGETTTPQGTKNNILIILILFIINPFIAFIYLIIKSASKK